MDPLKFSWCLSCRAIGFPYVGLTKSKSQSSTRHVDLRICTCWLLTLKLKLGTRRLASWLVANVLQKTALRALKRWTSSETERSFIDKFQEQRSTSIFVWRSYRERKLQSMQNSSAMTKRSFTWAATMIWLWWNITTQSIAYLKS